jgi:hypothetical protein
MRIRIFGLPGGGILHSVRVLNGKNLLLGLVLGAAVVAFLLYFPSGGGSSQESEKDSGRINPDVGDTGILFGRAAEKNDGTDLFERFPRDSKVSARLGAESEAVRERLREMQRMDDDGLEVVTMPDGHQSIHLQGRFQHVTRLVAVEDGSLVPVCGGYLPGEKKEVEDE